MPGDPRSSIELELVWNGCSARFDAEGGTMALAAAA
jgi:hypothetical protein